MVEILEIGHTIYIERSVLGEVHMGFFIFVTALGLSMMDGVWSSLFKLVLNSNGSGSN